MYSIPVQNPQADHCRLQEVGTYCQESRRLDQWVPELVLQERWRVQHRIHEQKQELSGFAYTWTDVAHAGMAWSGRAVLTDQQEQRAPFQWNGQSGVYKICFVPKLQTENSHSGHIFYIVGKTRPKHLFCALTNMSTPQLEPGILVCFYMEWTGML